MLTDADIEQRRTPAELRTFVDAVHKRVRANPAERHKGIVKSKDGPYKQFLEEIVPLALFAELAYPPDYIIEPVIGNQNYDANVFDKTGKEIERVEITNPHFGEWEGPDARLVAKRGYGSTRVFEPGADLNALQCKVIETCLKKATKNYANTTLVVAIDFMPPFSPEEAWVEPAIEAMRTALSHIRFQAKRVVLLAMPIQRLIPIAEPLA